VAGEEIGSRNGHLIGLYLEESVPSGLCAERTIGAGAWSPPLRRAGGSLRRRVDAAVTAGSDAHDVWYLGSAVTRFEGRSARCLRQARESGRTRAHLRGAWIQLCALYRFARLGRRQRRVAWAR
jgi:PHP-associated